MQRFLDSFTEALTSGDGQSAAELFEYPSLMVMADAQRYGPSRVLAEQDAVAGFFDRAPEMYNSRGIYETFPDIRSVDWLAPDLASVLVRFPYIDGDGNDMGDGEESLYLIRRAGRRQFAIVCCVALGVDSDRGRGRQATRTGRRSSRPGARPVRGSTRRRSIRR